MNRDQSGNGETNRTIASLLRDLASVQTSVQKKWGYKRAASAILNLDQPIEELVAADGKLKKIPGIGPASERIILEVLRTGGSATVDQAVAASDRHADVEKSRLLREHFLSRAQVVATLANRRLKGPSLDGYRGDLQMHSVWSDGAEPLEALVTACIERGYAYCAITDHSYGLPIANGVSMSNLKRQHLEIDALNRRFAGRFRMLKGIEANIRADGTVDMQPDELSQLEIVVASPHSALRSAADQTPRMIEAVRTRGVHILGHPRGRMFGSRPGVAADWPRVFSEAKKQGVAIEIDGDPARQDIDYELAKSAVAAGCVVALDSDAHSPGQLHYAETAVAHARLAGVPRDRVINTWPLEQLLDWAGRRR